MVYTCVDCQENWWSEDCPMSYKNGGSGVIVCPDCDGAVRMQIGPVEESIITTLPDDESLSKEELVSQTGYDSDEVLNALRHLIDMHYLGTTPKWNYRLGTKGREKKDDLN